jgi:BirA family biotin operon repressor/biotin-[acetyl-CoA-carboxylase] ligase
LKLSRSSDPLPAALAAAFDAARARFAPLGHRVLFFNTTASTNDLALAVAADADADAEGTVVIADQQTSGRGRLGRVWHSPRGTGLYVSIGLQPSSARIGGDRATTLLTLAAGVALSEAVEAVTAITPEIKWPNDLLVGRRKLAGILAESASSDLARIVLGYGINVGAMSLPADVDARATSLESELGRPVDRAALCAATLVAISERYRDLLAGRFDAILDAWRARSTMSRGARVTWTTPAGTHAGVTEGIDDRGALLVRAGDRVERIVGGEVNWFDL